MIKSSTKRCFEDCFTGYFIKVFICFLIALSMFSCTKDDVRRRQGRYGYSHYPNRTYTPNSGYYSKPYELYPQKSPYADYDQYYVMPYGYNQQDNQTFTDTR